MRQIYFNYYFIKMENTKETTTKSEAYEMIANQVGGVTPETVKVIHDNVAKGTTLSELTYFLNVAKGVGLNPFNKEIWCYKDNKGNLIVFAGRDGFLKNAQTNPSFNGIRSSEVKEEDEFEIDIAQNQIKHKVGKGARGKIIGAYAIVFRKDGEPTIVYVEFERYNKKYNTWSSHPEDMIKKVAESKALKLAFGISGLQLEEDFEVRDGIAIEPQNELRVIDSEYFRKFVQQDREYIRKHANKFALTDEQKEEIDIKLQEDGTEN